MYIEVLHDIEGQIISCYCTDTLPLDSETKFFEIEEDMPQGMSQCRINIDTITAMQIDSMSDRQGVERSAYVKENFIVNIVDNISLPNNVILPEGMNIKSMIVKT